MVRLLLPGDRIARQDTRYNISCTVNSVCNCTAGVACEVILELVQHIHGEGLLRVRARWDVTVSQPVDHQSESVQCCVAFENSNSSTTLSLCGITAVCSAAQLTTQTTGFLKGALFISYRLKLIVDCGMKFKSAFRQCHHCAVQQKA